MRKIIRGAMSVLMSASFITGAAAAAAAPTFSDVPEGHWAYAYVAEAAEQGWVSGVGGGLFAPDNQVTYAELSAMLVRAFFPDALSEQPTADGDPWYTAVCTAAEDLGLYVGVDIRTQHTNAVLVTQPVSRYEMAQILYNAMRAASPQGAPDLSAAQASTADWSSIPGRYQAAVAAVKAAGVITGTDGAGTFNGEASMSRAQAATVMTRLDDALATLPAEMPTAETPAETDTAPAEGTEIEAPAEEAPAEEG